MSNMEKLKAVMRKYKIDRVYYLPNMNLDDDILNGILFFNGCLNRDFMLEVYYIYTPDGCMLDDQDLDVWMAPEGTKEYDLYVTDAMAVMYA